MIKWKKLFLLSTSLLLFSVAVVAQPTIKWNFSAEKNDGNVYEVNAFATVPQGWHLYGVNTSVEGLETAQPTFSFEYEKAKPANELSASAKSEVISDAIFNKKVNAFTGDVSFSQHIQIDGTIPSSLKGNFTVYVAKNDEFYPVETPFNITLEGGTTAPVENSRIKLSTLDIANPVADCGAAVHNSNGGSLLSIFLLGFIGGLIALVTPCVFPMIPVTVSFFTKRAPNKKIGIRNGVTYGLFIFLIYVLISVPFHIIGGVNPQIFNTISTNAWLNVSFFVIFIVFALSFFGFFEITLPGSIANRTDMKSGLGSIGGIFFMALTLAIVSFSCTGPILGSLLVGSLSGGAWQLSFGLAGFGIALALPFALFAIFPNWLEALPKSGGWLDTTKKILAFIELALAFKFLSNADLVEHWGILKREVFIGIWLLISLGLTAYLFGFIRLPHDVKGQKISTARKALGVLALLFIIYLIPGLTQSNYSNLNVLSGFPPPLSYSIYGKDNVKGKTLEANVVNDYEKAIQLAREQNKPLLIDFTGWACVNCRKMEENVWSQPDVHDYISENFILVSLYVDDRAKLPIEQRTTYTTSTGQQKDLTTLGDKWATFEAENFNQASQPLYAVLDKDEKLVTHPVGYTPNAKEYLEWLKCGKENFER